MLIAPSLPATLDLLGVSESDRSELLGAIPRAVGDPALLEAVTEVAALLRAAAGPGAEPPDLRPRREHDDALQQAVVPGQGLVAILAHLVSTDTVRAFHDAREIDPRITRHSLADLGQQMRVHREVTGGLGLHTPTYTSRIWAGAILAVGRLHVEIMRDESLPAPGWTAGIHIPEIGPLVLAEVEASLRAAVELLGRTFGDLGDGFGHRFRCRSWLLGPSIREATAPESNLAAFASLWSEEEVYDATEEAVYFVFRRQPPVAWQDLPTRTSLETAVVEHLRTHRPWRGALGRLER